MSAGIAARTALAFATTLVMLIPGPALAGPITSFSYAEAGAYVSFSFAPFDPANPTADRRVWDTSQPWDGRVESSVTSGSAPASAVNPGGTYEGATVESSALASLSSGELKAYESVTLAPLALADNARADATAQFGDSFSVFDSSGPLTWTDSHLVRFEMTLDGVWLPADNGSLGLDFGYGSPGAIVDGSIAGFVVQDMCSFGLGQAESLLGTMTCGGALTTDGAGNISGTVFAQFAPLGDFDWFAGMHVLGWPGFLGTDRSSRIDLSRTATVTYAGPAGTTTYSASGLFPGTLPASDLAPIPEPATLVLLGVAVVASGAGRRFRRGTDRSV